MPYRYVIDKESRLVISTGWDRLTFAEAKALQDQLKNDPEFDPEFKRLIDFTALTAFDMSTDEAREIARRRVSSSPSENAIAILVSSPSIFGMARLMEAYRSIERKREQVRVFYDRAEALKWLGLPPTYQISN